MSGYQNYDLFLDLYYNMAPNISGTQKGTIILTTTHILHATAACWHKTPKMRFALAVIPSPFEINNKLSF